jgi:hypothetical protein
MTGVKAKLLAVMFNPADLGFIIFPAKQFQV